jgi:hypothetical protein
MSKIIGRLMSVGFGKETSRGTAVAPSYWVPQTEFTVFDKDDYFIDESALGRVEAVHDGDQAHQWAEGGFAGNLRDSSFGLILLGLFGTVGSVARSSPNAAVYDHTFTIANTATHQSLTIASKDANEDIRFALGMISKFEMTYELDKYVNYSCDFMAKKSASTSNTVAYTTENKFRPQDFALKIASTVAGLSGASATVVKSAKLTIEKNVEIDYALGSLAAQDIYNKGFTVELELTATYNDTTTFKDLVFNGTKQAVSLSLTRSDLTIGTSANPGFVWTADPGFFSEWQKTGGLGDVLGQTVKFRGMYSVANASMLKAVLTNLITSY